MFLRNVSIQNAAHKKLVWIFTPHTIIPAKAIIVELKSKVPFDRFCKQKQNLDQPQKYASLRSAPKNGHSVNHLGVFFFKTFKTAPFFIALTSLKSCTITFLHNLFKTPLL